MNWWNPVQHLGCQQQFQLGSKEKDILSQCVPFAKKTLAVITQTFCSCFRF